MFAPMVLALVALVLTWLIPLAQRVVRATDDDASPQAHQRIITIAPNAAEIICALGAADAIVAVDKFTVFPPELLRKPTIGGFFDPDIERMIALKPDLIVLRGHNETIEQLARERNIALYYDETDTLAGIEKCITDLGKMLRHEPEADVLARAFNARLDAIKKRVANRPRPRVLVSLSRSPDRLANLLTSGQGTFVHEMIELAGGENVFGHLDMTYPQVSGESILARRPQVIIEFMPEAKLTNELRTRIVSQWRLLGSIPAVIDDRIFIMTDEHCLIPSPRYVEIIEKVARLLHPEAFDEP